MKSNLKIVGIQADLIWENISKNLKEFEVKIHQLEDDVDLIVLPEMFTTGFTMNPSAVYELMGAKTTKWMQNLAKQKAAAITGSFVVKEDGVFYNRLLFVYPSGEIKFYDKKHTFTLAGEHKAYEAGTKKLIVKYKGWKICPLICYDLRFPAWSRNLEDYDLLIYMANWPVTRIKAWDTLLKARAIENMTYVIGVNRVGKDANDYIYSGNSLIVDYLGNTLSDLSDYTQGIISKTINFKDQLKVRNKLGFLNDRDQFSIKNT